MKWFIAALAFISLTASAQELKWSLSVDGPVYGFATDGFGGLAVAHNPPPFGAHVRTTWIDGKGRPVLTNDIIITEGVVEDIDVRIVRFNKSEIALLVEVDFDNAPSTNYLHRIQRDGTVTDTALSMDEVMDAESSKLIDGRGFFTRIEDPFYTFRRYSN